MGRNESLSVVRLLLPWRQNTPVRRLPRDHSQCTANIKCFALRPVHLITCTSVWLFSPSKTTYLCVSKKARSTCQPSSLRESGFTAFLSRKKGKNLITLKSVDQHAEHIGPTKVPHSSHPAIMKQWPFSNNQRINQIPTNS